MPSNQTTQGANPKKGASNKLDPPIYCPMTGMLMHPVHDPTKDQAKKGGWDQGGETGQEMKKMGEKKNNN